MDGFQATIIGDGYAETANPMSGVNPALANLAVANSLDEIKSAVREVVTAINDGFNRFIEDQRTRQSVAEADSATSTQTENAVVSATDAQNEAAKTEVTVRNIVKQENANTDSIAADRNKKSSQFLGSISEKVTGFTNSMKPILPSLQTFGIAFATTSLATMFLVKTMISAIKFIFANPGMFLGAILGGTLLFQIFKEPIMRFLNPFIDNIKKQTNTLVKSGIKTIIKDVLELAKEYVNGFFSRFGKATEDIKKEIMTMFSDAWKFIKSFIDDAVNKIITIPEKLESFFNMLVGKVPEFIQSVIGGIKNLISNPMEYIRGAVDSIKSVGAIISNAVSIISGAVNSLINMTPTKLLGKAKDAAGGVMSWVKGKIQDRADSIVSKETGVSVNDIRIQREQQAEAERTIVKNSIGEMMPSLHKSKYSTNGISSSNINPTSVINKNTSSDSSLKEMIKGGNRELADSVKSTIDTGLKPVEELTRRIANAADESSKTNSLLEDSTKDIKEFMSTELRNVISSALANKNSKPAQTVIINNGNTAPEGARFQGMQPPEE